jgi:hypothetical protein
VGCRRSLQILGGTWGFVHGGDGGGVAAGVAGSCMLGLGDGGRLSGEGGGVSSSSEIEMRLEGLAVELARTPSGKCWFRMRLWDSANTLSHLRFRLGVAFVAASKASCCKCSA